MTLFIPQVHRDRLLIKKSLLSVYPVVQHNSAQFHSFTITLFTTVRKIKIVVSTKPSVFPGSPTQRQPTLQPRSPSSSTARSNLDALHRKTHHFSQNRSPNFRHYSQNLSPNSHLPPQPVSIAKFHRPAPISSNRTYNRTAYNAHCPNPAAQHQRQYKFNTHRPSNPHHHLPPAHQPPAQQQLPR